MKNKKMIVICVGLLIAILVSGISIWNYRNDKVTAGKAENIISEEEEKLKIDDIVEKRLKELAIVAADITNSSIYIEAENPKKITELEKENAKKILEEKLYSVYSRNSEFAKDRLTIYSELINLVDDNRDYLVDGGIKNLEFYITDFDEISAQGKLIGTAFSETKDTSLEDDTAEGENSYVENRCKYNVTFVFENGEWKVDTFRLDSL